LNKGVWKRDVNVDGFFNVYSPDDWTNNFFSPDLTDSTRTAELRERLRQVNFPQKALRKVQMKIWGRSGGNNVPDGYHSEFWVEQRPRPVRKRARGNHGAIRVRQKNEDDYVTEMR
jgi:hypothetical protein